MTDPLVVLAGDASNAVVTASPPRAKRPKGGGWSEAPIRDPRMLPYLDGASWLHEASGVRVLSTTELIDGRGLEWHVSVSLYTGAKPTRAGRYAMRLVRKAFGMEAADEDNHVPNGIVRNLWLPIADIGACECVETERPIVEAVNEHADERGDDYVWRR